MKFRKRLLVLTAFLIAGLALVAGCGGADQETPSGAETPSQTESPSASEGTETPSSPAADPVELNMLWWGSQDRHDLTLQAIGLFEQKYPHIKVNSEFLGWDGYWDKLSVQVSAGNAPDVIQMSFAYLNDYVVRGALHPMDGLGVDFDQMDPSFAYEATIDGKIYGVPLSIQSHSLVYNPRLLQEAGVDLGGERMSFDRFVEITTQVSKALGGQGVFGVSDGTANISFIQYYMKQRGYSLFEGNEIAFPEDVLVDYLSFWNDLRLSGATSSGEITASYFEAGVENAPIVNGQAAFSFAPLPIYSTFQNLSPEPLELTLLPSMDGAEEGFFIESGFYWSMGGNTKHPEEAALLINFLVNDAEAGEILALNRGIPASKPVREAIVQNLDETQAKSLAYLGEVEKVATPLENYVTPPGSSEVWSLLSRLAQEMQFDRKTPEQAAAEFIAEANAMLARAN